MMKKFLSFFICSVLLVSSLVMPVSAASSLTVRIRASSTSVSVGGTVQLNVVNLDPANSVEWSTNDNDIVSVDNSGVVTGLKRGSATITAKVKDSSGKVLGTGRTKISVGYFESAKRVRIISSSKTVRVKRTIQLEVAVSPDTIEYDEVEWLTLDYDIASVDDYGEVTGIKPGVATIVARIYNTSGERRVELGEGEIEITVSPSITSSVIYDDGDIDSAISRSSSKSSSSASSSKTVAKDKTVPTKTVNEAVNKALVAGTTTSTTFTGYTTVSTVSLESAAADMQMGGGVVLLNFDTLSSDGKSRQGRLTINPRSYKPVKYSDPTQIGHSLNVAIYTDKSVVGEISDMFKKYFKNDIAVIKAGQKGSYGMNVTYTVNVGNTFSKSKLASLKLYSYDPDNGKAGTYKLVKNANISIDDNNDIHFTTNMGDYLIVTSGELARR